MKHIILTLLILISFSSNANMVRCKNGIVAVGDKASLLKKRCSKPKESGSVRRFKNQYDFKFGTPPKKGKYYKYSLGYGKFDKFVFVHNNKIVLILTGNK